MQRLFSMFPAGGPGIGLLLLRLSLAATLVIHVWGRPPVPTYAWLAPSFASFLTVGLFTPMAAALGVLLEISHAVLSRGDVLPVALQVAQAVAVALLGPGAYSVDALWYGRRLVRGPSTRDVDRR